MRFTAIYLRGILAFFCMAMATTPSLGEVYRVTCEGSDNLMKDSWGFGATFKKEFKIDTYNNQFYVRGKGFEWREGPTPIVRIDDDNIVLRDGPYYQGTIYQVFDRADMKMLRHRTNSPGGPLVSEVIAECGEFPEYRETPTPLIREISWRPGAVLDLFCAGWVVDDEGRRVFREDYFRLDMKNKRYWTPSFQSARWARFVRMEYNTVILHDKKPAYMASGSENNREIHSIDLDTGILKWREPFADPDIRHCRAIRDTGPFANAPAP